MSETLREAPIVFRSLRFTFPLRDFLWVLIFSTTCLKHRFCCTKSLHKFGKALLGLSSEKFYNWCQEKISSKKSSQYGIRGRVRVRLEIGLGLEYGRGGGFWGFFFLEPLQISKYSWICYSQFSSSTTHFFFLSAKTKTTNTKLFVCFEQTTTFFSCCNLCKIILASGSSSLHSNQILNISFSLLTSVGIRLDCTKSSAWR